MSRKETIYKDIVVPGKPRHSECFNLLKYQRRKQNKKIHSKIKKQTNKQTHDVLGDLPQKTNT